MCYSYIVPRLLHSKNVKYLYNITRFLQSTSFILSMQIAPQLLKDVFVLLSKQFSYNIYIFCYSAWFLVQVCKKGKSLNAQLLVFFFFFK